MAKIKNITPEEREQAISTIENIGEQVTDERIEYYIQLRRNTVKHQEEKAIKEAVNQITEQNKVFARNVLSYMGRSKSDRQISVYSRKHEETLSYIKENKLDIDYTPSIFGEATFYLEKLKPTTIHHLTAEDLAICIKDKKTELLNVKNHKEAEKKERTSKEMKMKMDNEGGKAVRFSKIALWIGIALILGPFYISGFGFGLFWYLVIIGIVICSLMLLGTDGRSEGDYSFVKTILMGYCAVGLIMYLWGPLNPNYSDSSNSNSDNPYNMPKVYYTEPCEECGAVGKYYIAEDGSKTGDTRYALHGHFYCISCYKIKKQFSDALGF